MDVGKGEKEPYLSAINYLPYYRTRGDHSTLSSLQEGYS